ncbi:M60 family metallopeptidase [Bacteroidales bacterium OttesenSCG-928-M11]|nr:M60 family metallopeptidase [Bacteroidales bacterium OttesenSCG-928-M11]
MKRYLFLLCGLFLLFSSTADAQRWGRRSSVEMDFYQNRGLFADNVYGTPSEDFDLRNLDKVKQPKVREILTQILSGEYPTEFRVQEYRSYLHPQQLAKIQKTSAYSQFENPTGIYFSEGDSIIVIMDKHNPADSIKLRITNFGEKGGNSVYNLRPGFNIIVPENEGTGYIQYFTEKKEPIKKVKAHIIGGKVNGYFDINKHNNHDWAKLLNNASAETMDIVGKRVQLIYSINSLKEFCPNDAERLVFLYDSIISIQHEIMGLNKYNRVPENHILGRVIWKGFMHADGMGAAFHDNTMKELANPQKIPTNLWGIAHEFGHVNQIRPWMTWVGTTEVTNNIYSVWSQYLFNPENPKLEREVLKDYDGRVAGGRITAYMESSFIHKQEWLTQAGPDRWDRSRPRDWGGDHFVKLVPFWQLQLYFKLAGKGNSWYCPDFYADIFIKAMDKQNLPEDSAEAQLEFIKQACDASKTDLTDFFTYSGMLRPINKWVDDYTCAQMTITEDDIKEVKKYASKYKKPSTPVLHYITANSIDCYKNKLAVKGNLNEGITTNEDGSLTIDHRVWQNAVAFETYQGDKLIKIAFVGAGSKDNKTTLVRFPNEATHVEAVEWNGKRYRVKG